MLFRDVWRFWGELGIISLRVEWDRYRYRKFQIGVTRAGQNQIRLIESRSPKHLMVTSDLSEMSDLSKMNNYFPGGHYKTHHQIWHSNSREAKYWVALELELPELACPEQDWGIFAGLYKVCYNATVHDLTNLGKEDLASSMKNTGFGLWVFFFKWFPLHQHPMPA